MGKYEQFIKPLKPEGQLPKLIGNYGCQSCEENTDHAWFDDKKGIIFWFCSEGHRSEIKIGV